jgi:D-glycero-D-manno-heptose 1,7-bisphosphate phosphatase
MMGLRRAVFLDRDGVLNRAIVVDGRPYPPRRLHDLEIDSTAVLGCRALKKAGFALICVTNQPDVAQGKMVCDDLDAINQAVGQALGLDDVIVCPHSDEDQCSCRKPKPGMIVVGALKHSVDLAVSFMVGDRWRDVEAGEAAGCRTIFIDRGYDERRPQTMSHTCMDLREAAAFILSHGGEPPCFIK